MSTESHCPTCGSKLSSPGQPCPYCTEAQRLLQHLVVDEEVHLCVRCGTILQPDEDELCKTCQLQGHAPTWRREDRIARWIRDRVVEPAFEQPGAVCPSCGRPVLLLDIFCAQCGARLATTTPSEVQPEGSSPPEKVAVQMATASATSPETTSSEAVEKQTEPMEKRAIPLEPIESSFWQRSRNSIQEQFRPVGQTQVPATPFWQQIWGFMRSVIQPSRPSSSQVWMWILIGVIILALVVIVAFWAQMLSSGGIVLR